MLEIPSDCFDLLVSNDVKQTWVGNNYAMEGIIHENDGEGHTDSWGVEWVKEGSFNQIRKSPLEYASEEEILSYKFPYKQIEQLLTNMEKVLPYSKELLSKAAAFAIETGEKACSKFPLDWLWTGDDVGGQASMMISPELWREMLKPHLKEIFDVGRKRDLWIAYHSCGAIRPIIPDLIEIGLDVLNPIQRNCPGMDPYELKKEFGGELTFMGGLDTQYLVPNGTSEEVYKETLNLIEGMTVDGGSYILAASHTIPPETPVENIFAMYSAAGVSSEEIYDRAADVRNRSEK